MEQTMGPLSCYSRLGKILSDTNMTVTNLRRALARRGLDVNVKTLYRLADPTAPIERLDTAIAGGICQILGVTLSQLLAFEAIRREAGLQRLPPPRQRRLDALLERHSEGRLPPAERRELADLVDEAERLTLRNARTLARVRKAAGRD